MQYRLPLNILISEQKKKTKKSNGMPFFIFKKQVKKAGLTSFQHVTAKFCNNKYIKVKKLKSGIRFQALNEPKIYFLQENVLLN